MTCSDFAFGLPSRTTSGGPGRGPQTAFRFPPPPRRSLARPGDSGPEGMTMVRSPSQSCTRQKIETCEIAVLQFRANRQGCLIGLQGNFVLQEKIEEIAGTVCGNKSLVDRT